MVRRIEADRARVAMMASYQAVTDDVGKLRDDELAWPSRCQGWSRADLLFHLLLDAQRALVTFATPAASEPDVDFISYWVPFRPGAEGYTGHARFVRRVASSYPHTSRAHGPPCGTTTVGSPFAGSPLGSVR